MTLWHRMYGNVNLKILKILKQRSMVIHPIKDANKNICEGRIMGKMNRLPFTKLAWRAKAPLQLVHNDIWGLACDPDLEGKRYFLLFMDDYTCMNGCTCLNKNHRPSYISYNSRPLQRNKVATI